MARQVNGTSHKAEKQGSGLGGGPVGSSGGYSGRPGGNSTSGANGDRAGMGSGGSNGLLLAGILALLLGKGKSGGGGNGGKGGGLGRILRLVILAVVIIAVLRACSSTGGMVSSYNDVSSYTTQQTPAPTPAPASSNGGLGSVLPSFTGSYSSNSSGTTVAVPQAPAAPVSAPSASSSYSGYSSGLDALLGGYSAMNSGTYSSSGWINGSNCGRLNTSVAPGARQKYTQLNGNGNDTVTIMVYMCGTDLESNYGMGTNDLQEMASSKIADNVNLIVYTGGCTGWKNNLMSNKTNQIFKIESGGKFRVLNDNVGNLPMTSADTLSSFIQFCNKYFPANRNMLIFWDHGGGSITGYGYDQRFKNSGSMSLDGINKALANGGVKFDFVGFDACLMATAETAEVVSKYADYMIASEESEPGIGWYYTNWLNKLSGNTSTSTLEIGKQIVDDFVDVCGQQCRGQDTTLSLTDLAEFSATVPQLLNNWADATTSNIQTNYKAVSQARGSSKEFAASSKIDQVDLACLAYNLNDNASQQLANALLSAVKYNRTSSTVKNAYGLSVFFPYRSVKTVKNAVSTYSSIGMDSNYSKCIQAFATYASSGQASSYSNGYGNALGSILSGYGSSSSGSSSGYGTSSYDISGLLGQALGSSGYGSSSYSSSYGSAADMYSLLAQMMGGRSLGGVRGLTEENSSFIADTFNEGILNQDDVAQFLSDNQFNASALVWTRGEDGKLQLQLPADQWELINELQLSVFRDDGTGFIDLGLDLNGDYFNGNGALVGEFDQIWLAINGNEVAYYQMYTVTDESGNTVTTGRVPCLYNGQRANLIIEIANDVPAVVGVCYDYHDGETDAIAKSITEYSSTDTVQFVADCYDYDNNYLDNYAISDEFTVGSGLTAEYMYVADAEEISACFRFTDIYGQTYWTPVMALAEIEQ